MSYPNRVFLIDDDEDDCYFFDTAIFEIGCGIEFLYDQDSENALRCLSSGQVPVPDLLFLDWNMPKKTGKQCLAAIKQLPRYSDVPIIIITTSSAQQDQDEAKRLGASYFLTKPSTIPELNRLLLHIFSINWIQ